jgi:hypothetical protein
MVETEQDWTEEAVRLRREEDMATAEIAERVGRSASQVRKVLAKANTDRAINGAPESNGNGHHPEVEKPQFLGYDDGKPVIYGQTDIVSPRADVSPEDDPDHPGWAGRDEFVAEAGEAVGAMPGQPEPEQTGYEVRLKGTRQLCIDFGENADTPIGGTLVVKSDKLASGFYGLGDVITGTFTARVVDVAGKERLQRASDEFRAQPQHHVALITEIAVKAN